LSRPDGEGKFVFVWNFKQKKGAFWAPCGSSGKEREVWILGFVGKLWLIK
jgi:hypothetical protein